MKVFIFTSLKVVRDGDLNKAYSSTHNIITSLKLRPAVQTIAYFSWFFIVLKKPIHTVKCNSVGNTIRLLTQPRRGEYDNYLIRVYEWLISSDRTSDTINDRLRSLASFFLFFLNGGKGADFFT